MEIEPHEDDVFYDSLGMRLWEKRHLKACTILESENIKRVPLFILIPCFSLLNPISHHIFQHSLMI